MRSPLDNTIRRTSIMCCPRCKSMLTDYYKKRNETVTIIDSVCHSCQWMASQAGQVDPKGGSVPE